MIISSMDASQRVSSGPKLSPSSINHLFTTPDFESMIEGIVITCCLSSASTLLTSTELITPPLLLLLRLLLLQHLELGVVTDRSLVDLKRRQDTLAICFKDEPLMLTNEYNSSFGWFVSLFHFLEVDKKK